MPGYLVIRGQREWIRFLDIQLFGCLNIRLSVIENGQDYFPIWFKKVAESLPKNEGLKNGF